MLPFLTQSIVDVGIKNQEEHPTMGTGQIEQLKGDKSGLWSRKITRKHRLIYSVNDSEIKVLVISTHGHYEDK